MQNLLSAGISLRVFVHDEETRKASHAKGCAAQRQEKGHTVKKIQFWLRVNHLHIKNTRVRNALLVLWYSVQRTTVYRM